MHVDSKRSTRRYFIAQQPVVALHALAWCMAEARHGCITHICRQSEFLDSQTRTLLLRIVTGLPVQAALPDTLQPGQVQFQVKHSGRLQQLRFGEQFDIGQGKQVQQSFLCSMRKHLVMLVVTCLCLCPA